MIYYLKIFIYEALNLTYKTWLKIGPMTAESPKRQMESLGKATIKCHCLSQTHLSLVVKLSLSLSLPQPNLHFDM